MRVAYWNRILRSPAGKIMAALRRGRMTVDELAAALSLSGNAVRPQLATLERDGLVQPGEMRRGASKPARTYALTAEAELQFSRAYVPVLTQLLDVLGQRLKPRELSRIMRDVGRQLVGERQRPTGGLRERVEAASALLGELGGLTRIERLRKGFRIRGLGCPLAAATERHPEACDAVQGLLSEFVGVPVSKCCDLEDRPRCCFEIGVGAPSSSRRARKG